MKFKRPTNLQINKLLLNYISVRDYYLMCSYMNNIHCYESMFRLLPGYRDLLLASTANKVLSSIPAHSMK
jgi:hypothetical protein